MSSNIDNTSGGMPPVIICTQQRSGSTLLRNLIGAHPLILGAPIGVGPLSHHLSRAAYFLAAAARFDGTEAELRDRANREARRGIDGLITPYLQAAGKAIWCDKSFEGLEHLADVHAVFPDARYICLYRHGLDVVQSNMAVGKLGYIQEVCDYIRHNPRNVVQALVESWIDKTTLLLEFERLHPESCFRLRYEDLVTRPDSALPALFEFIGVDFDAAVLERAFSGQGRVAEGDAGFHTSHGLYADSVGKGRSIPLTAVAREVADRMQALLDELGYEDGATAPSGEEPDVRDIVEAGFPAILRAHQAEGSLPRGTVELRVHGGGTWIIDTTGEEACVRHGDGSTDCAVGLSAGTLYELASGRKNLAAALENGEIDAVGNVDLALAMGRILLRGGETGPTAS